MKQKITLSGNGRYNYHNMSDLVIIAERREDGSALVTNSQYKRIRRHFCGIADCTCNSGPAVRAEFAGGEKIISVKF